VRASSLICSRDKIDSSRYFQKGRDSATEQKMTSPSHTETGKKKSDALSPDMHVVPEGGGGKTSEILTRYINVGGDITFLLGTLGYFE